MKKKRKTVIIVLVLFLCLGVGIFLVKYSPPRYFWLCHRALSGAFDAWWLENTNTTRGVYPNIEGDGVKSLVVVGDYFGNAGMDLAATDEDVDAAIQLWEEKRILSEKYCAYRYVPGLKHDDPLELIMMYVKKPTRNGWHGHKPRIWTRKRWVVFNPQFDAPRIVTKEAPHGMRDHRYDGIVECNEWIDTEEFVRRLKKTLNFLEENNRPYWTNVVEEHTAFLQSIEGKY